MAPEKRMITLTSFDGKEFVVDEAVAMMSSTVKHMIEDDCADSSIPLQNVAARTLAKVIEYCRKNAEMDKKVGEDNFSAEHELNAWDKEYVKVDQSDLFDLLMAANYLDIKGLVDLTCQTVANMMTGKSPEEIRTLFHIVNDYTREEEEEVRRENRWAFFQ